MVVPFNSAKRYLAKPEYRIPLDELFESETDRLIAALTVAPFSVQGGFSDDDFRIRAGNTFWLNLCAYPVVLLFTA